MKSIPLKLIPFTGCITALLMSLQVQALDLTDDTRFYVPPPNSGAVDQYWDLAYSGQRLEASMIKEMIDTPQAVWITQGTPEEARRQTKRVTRKAASKNQVPVIALYNIPFRDCAQYSAGGATSPGEYVAWVEGVAAGIGDRDAVVILEPDGLGIIPFYQPLYGEMEWCQPAEANPSTAADDRFYMMNTAVQILKAQPNTKVYLDGTHSAWLSVGEAADRLVRAGIWNADGFFLNTSNYQPQTALETFGYWVSACLTICDAEGHWHYGHFDWCASQYVDGVADYSPENVAAVNSTYADLLADVGEDPAANFVIDTSRNGIGPWVPEMPTGVEGDPQDWCNPPDRGIGLRPSTETTSDLIDAYLWIKLPGESDGECNRWEPRGEPDPVRGMIDPAASVWFPEMALELVTYANPEIDLCSWGHNGH